MPESPLKPHLFHLSQLARQRQRQVLEEKLSQKDNNYSTGIQERVSIILNKFTTPQNCLNHQHKL